MDNDFVIYDARWILESDLGAKTFARIEQYNKPLVGFLLGNGLLAHPDAWIGFSD